MQKGKKKEVKSIGIKGIKYVFEENMIVYVGNSKESRKAYQNNNLQGHNIQGQNMQTMKHLIFPALLKKYLIYLNVNNGL